jgi:dolichol-phosphate mannosyltransferase
MIDGLRVAVVIPAFHVARQLPDVIRQMPASVDQVIVVDDASPDDLGNVLSSIEDPRVLLIRHETNQGVGGATVTGMLAAMRDGAEVIVKCDGDGQMDPGDIPALVEPIAAGWADHVKGSRYHHAKELGSMPRARLLGNIGLTFLTKLCSGYWNVLDPVNGFFATRAEVLGRIQLEQLSRRYFFESDLLIRLNIIEAKVADMPQPAHYGEERSSLSITRAFFQFPWHLMSGLARRIFWRYLFYDVSPVAAFGIVGLLLATFGIGFGSWQWAAHLAQGVATPLGTIMLAAAPLALGCQLLLQAVILDIGNTPRAMVPTSALIPSSRPSPRPRPRPAQRAGLEPVGEHALREAPSLDHRPGSAALERRASLARRRFSEHDAGFRVMSALCVVCALFALADLAVRAALRLDLRWDTFMYHLPFAALRGGVHLTYELSDAMLPFFQGFPPLPDLVQGVLWRLTGSMNATGVVNALAFGAFLAYCHRAFEARFWVVTVIALTAPMVLIHTTTSYVDLFANSFLAAGACSCLYLFLVPDEARRGVLLGGLLALTLAAWSKVQLVVVVALLFCILAVVTLRRPSTAGFRRAQVALLGVGAALVAALPYLKNLVVYGNPFWPMRLPLIGDRFPYTRDMFQDGIAQRPFALRGLSQFALFFHSLFEINHPTSYAHRPRWIIDQGNADIAFRMGGFWGVAAVAYLAVLMVALVVCFRRRGAIAALGSVLVLAFVATLPQSHELRYYLFIPLSGAATIGMLLPRLEQIAPRAALGTLMLSLGLFLYMVSENWVHYRIERVDQLAAAHAWGADSFWPKLEHGKTYCAVDLMPMAMLLTGPTLSDYQIVDRTRADLCPAGSTLIHK